MRILLIALIAVTVLATQSSYADKIYTWTDKNGVKQFSDQPPETVDDYQTIEVQRSENSSEDEATAREAQDAYDKMIKEVQNENRQTDMERAQEAKQKELKEKEAAEAARKAKIQAERDRLQKQIDELKGRALSPTFSPGMRDNLIKQIQEQIDALE